VGGPAPSPGVYVLPLPALLLWMYDRPRTRVSQRRWLVAGAALALGVFPLVLQPGYWQSKIAGTIFYNAELTGSAFGLGQHVIDNLLYAPLAFLYTVEESHFVVSSYIDPLSGALVLIGLADALYQGRRQRFGRFALLAFGLLLLLVGVSHDRGAPSTTRMFMLLPWYALFTALGLAWLMARLKASRTPAGLRLGLLAGLVWVWLRSCKRPKAALRSGSSSSPTQGGASTGSTGCASCTACPPPRSNWRKSSSKRRACRPKLKPTCATRTPWP
jgi:hypothetical protein